MSELIFLLSLAVTGLLILCVVFYDFYRRESSFLGSYVCFFLLLSYVFVPLLIFYSSIGVNVYFLDDLAFFKRYFSISSAVVLVFFCSFFLGYFLPSGRGRYYIYFAVPSPSRFVVVLFLISFVAFFFFVYMYGWLGYVLANASQIRSGTDPNKNYVGAFAKMFSYYIEVVVLFVFARLLTGQRWRWVLIFLVVLCVALFKSFIDAGRGGLLNIIVGLFFVYVFIKSRFPLTFPLP